MMYPGQQVQFLPSQCIFLQRSSWVDDLFKRLDKFETKIEDKVDKFDSTVSSLNSRFVIIEVLVDVKRVDNLVDDIGRFVQVST